MTVDKNKDAFTWGRVAAANAQFVQNLLQQPSAIPLREEPLEAVIERRTDFLKSYQDDDLAGRYVDLVNQVRVAENEIIGDTADTFSRAVATAYFKTLAYKDEYEVARLHTSGDFIADLRQRYGPQAKLRFHLAPPLLNGRKDARGRPRKREFGAWVLPLFRVLARLKRLRGSAFDIFGYTAERRMERQLITELEQTVSTLLSGLTAANVDEATAIVKRYLDIRGYGLVKEQAAVDVRNDVTTRMAKFQATERKAA